MKWHISSVVVILSFFYNEVLSNSALVDIKSAISVAKKIIGAIESSKSAIDMMKDLLGVTDTSNDAKQILLNRLDHFEVNIPEDIQQAAQIDGDLREMFNEMGDINFLYNSYYLRYLNNDISNASLNDFITKATSIHADGPSRRATKIFNIICPEELVVVKGSFLDRAVTQLNTEEHHRCKKLKSPQQYIFELWNLIGTIEFRAFTMITSAYKLRSFATDADNQLDIKRADEEHRDRMHKYLTSIEIALSQAITNVSRCQPTYRDNYLTKKGGISYISLIWVHSDYFNNKVITGIRFVVVDNILQLQVEEGKLIADGEIEVGSNNWVPTQMNFDSDRQKIVWNESSTGTVDASKYTDYIALRWNTKTLFHHADVINTCSDCVLVGVKFQVHRKLETFVYYVDLEYAKFDIKTGAIFINSVSSKSEYFNESPENIIYKKDKPTIKVYSHKIRAYFDSNSLYTEPRLPFAGIGIYPVSDPDHEKAVSFRIFTHDLASNINTEL